MKNKYKIVFDNILFENRRKVPQHRRGNNYTVFGICKRVNGDHYFDIIFCFFGFNIVFEFYKNYY